MSVSTDTATLLVSCRDRTGLVATLSNFVFVNGGNILDLDQHSEEDSGTFFMRLKWSLAAFILDRAGIAAALAEFARTLGIEWSLTYGSDRQRVAVLVSKTPHCLYDLLQHHQLGELGGDIVLVLSNHADLQPVAKHFDIPFLHIPVDAKAKAAGEQKQASALAEHKVDLVVLARYMQILSASFVRARAGRIINIHHSFLPAFVGAKPYHQARQRGVKVIGATAHYVTEELDQGPIIEQDVARVSHRDDTDELVRKGRDLERRTLTRAVRLHLERRVLIAGNRTIVFA